MTNAMTTPTFPIVTKVEINDLVIEYEVFSTFFPEDNIDQRDQIVATGLSEIELRESATQSRLDELNLEIDRLTNHADGLDYAIAVCSGVLAGSIDSLWVEEFSFERGKAWSNKTVNNFVMKVAKKNGYDGDRLDGAIQHLENKFKMPSDNIWKGEGVNISAKSHHLDDFAHHPTLLGLFFSILTQFTEKAYFSNQDGNYTSISIDESGKELIGHDFPTKIFCGTVNWLFHLVSDVSGSNKTAGAGMGIPGPVIAMLKELSALPIIRKSGLAKKIHDVYVKEKFDLRGEMAVSHELGRQALPILLNEGIVRAFYFIRRLIAELREKLVLSLVDWKKTLPWKNRTIVRMLVIAHGAFSAIDLGDAAIRAGITEATTGESTAEVSVMRVNFVGIGRVAVAIYSDVKMGWHRNKKINEKLTLGCQQMQLMQAKVFYKQADMWIGAENAEQAIQAAMGVTRKAIAFHTESLGQIARDMSSIGGHVGKLHSQDRSDLYNILRWS